MISARLRPRRLLAHLVLALLLMLAQHQGSRHALAHVSLVIHEQGPVASVPATAHAPAPAPAHSSCSDCDSYAVVGAPLPMADAAPAFAPHGAAVPCCARAWPNAEVAAVAAYDSRAPPALI